MLDGLHFASRFWTVASGPSSHAFTQGSGVCLCVFTWKCQIVPGFNVPGGFHLPERNIDPRGQLIIAHPARRRVALAVNALTDLMEPREPDVTARDEVFPGVEYVDGVAKFEDGIVMIHGLDRFLS
jgi:purine-binding chemotaxis protein CheW